MIDLYDVTKINWSNGCCVIKPNGIELQDREFIAAIQEGRMPNSCVTQAIEAMKHYIVERNA